MAKGMILAAGQGTRVRPLTKQIPKPMIPILGKPVMAYLLEHLARHDITEVMVNVAYNHHLIENYFGDGRGYGMDIGYSYEGVRKDGELSPLPMGSAGGMRLIQDFGGFFDDTTVVLCGDAIIDIDFKAAIAEHKAKGAIATVITLEVPLEQVSSYGVVVSDADGRVVSFQEKPKVSEAKSRNASTGIYIFEPAALELVPPGMPFDIGSQLFPLLVEKGLPFYAQNHSFHWIDIGQLNDYWDVSMRVLRGEVADMKMPGREIRPGVWVGLNTHISPDAVIEGPVYIGANVRIEPNVHIQGPAWIGHGSVLRHGVKLSQTIVFEYTRISAEQVIEAMIMSPEYAVERHGATHYHGEERAAYRWGDARG